MFEEIKKILKDDVIDQIKRRMNNDIVLFKMPKEVKCSTGVVPLRWNHKVYILTEIMLMYKGQAVMYCFEDGINDEYRNLPYYWYSYISLSYNFNRDRRGVYRSDMFGLIFPKSKFYKWSSIGEVNKVDVDKYIT